jgi:hypothetical protein
MSTTNDVSFSADETKVVFSGVGQIVLLPMSGGSYHLGGTDAETNGILLTNNVPFTLYVTSPDDVYLWNSSQGSSGSVRVYHNR